MESNHVSTHNLSKRDLNDLSRKLSRILRHDALKLNIPISSDGNVLVSDVINHLKSYNKNYNIDHIIKVVEENDKKRFEISTSQNELLMIRAVQGHTLTNINDEELLDLIDNPASIPLCIHGTYKNVLSSIIKNGLNRMKRNHIHFAIGEPNDLNVISGIRKSCEVLIYIDIHKAMNANIKFYRSKNNVILTKGINDSGILPSEYFLKIIEINFGKLLINL